jgi:hypothetical protein
MPHFENVAGLSPPFVIAFRKATGTIVPAVLITPGKLFAKWRGEL